MPRSGAPQQPAERSRRPDDREPTDPGLHINLWYAVAAILLVVLARDFLRDMQEVETVPYSRFAEWLAADRIESLVVTEEHVRGRLRSPQPGEKAEFVARRVDVDLARELAGRNVEVVGQTERTLFGEIVAWLLPAVVFIAVWLFVVRRFAERGLGGGYLSVGRNKARIYAESSTRVTFADVAGVDEARAELEEVVAFLRDPRRYGRLGGRIPKGILLVGPPGTGKTLLARAVAGEAGVPFFSINGSEFVEMFVGVGAARVRDLFAEARKRVPCIIFIDELDALGRARTIGFGGGHDEKEQTLNQLLSELDGFDPTHGLVLLAATNRPEILDPALLRAGRFDRQVLVDRPDRAGRVAILRVHVRRIVLAGGGADGGVDLDTVASMTPGFTGADLANLVNEAALLATRRDAVAVTLEDFTAAIERIVAGLEKRNRLLNAREREIVAWHEMGHALVGMALARDSEVHKVSIIPRGIGALGYTIARPLEDRFLMTRGELEDKAAVALGGRAAEDLAFGHTSTGAADDLVRATDIARAMVMQYGMVPALGHVAFERPRSALLPEQPALFAPSPREFSDETAREIDCAVRSLVEAAFQRARAVLAANRCVLDDGARALLARETLDAPALAALRARLVPVADAPRPEDAGAAAPAAAGQQPAR
jgi:cell division protease FtsH